MSDYSARFDEVKSALNDVQRKDIEEAGAPGGDQAVASVYGAFLNGFSSYCDMRERVLSDALATLSQTDTASPTDRQSRWVDRFSRASSDAQRAVMDLLRDAEKAAPRLRAYGETIAKQEAEFFNTLGRVPLAYFQGAVQGYHDQFTSASKGLLDQWRALGDSSRGPNVKATETLNHVHDLFTKAVEAVVAGDRDITEKLRNLKMNPDRTILTGSPGNTIGALFKGGMQALNLSLERYRETTAAYVKDLAEAFAAQEAIIVTFTEIRAAVRAFLEKTNLNTAISEFNESRGNAASMADHVPTDRQRDDARRFIERAVSAVEPLMSRFKDDYERFISDHRGVFVGAVDLTRIDQLLSLSANENSWHSSEDLNIQRSLQELYDHSMNWQVSVNGLNEAGSRALQDAFKIELQPLAKNIVAVHEDHYVDQVKKLIADKFSSWRDRLRNSRGGGD